MRTNLYLRSKTDLLAEMEARLTDTGNTLATEPQYYAALNEAIRMWGGRVVAPMIHTFTDGFTSGTYEYTLPNYIRPPFRVQVKSSTYSYLGVRAVDDDNNYTWEDVVGYSIEPTSTGGFALRLPISPIDEDARILWFAENGLMPTVTTVDVGTELSASATSLVLTMSAAPDIGESGYIKIDNEYISYSGVTRTSGSAHTLLNLTRGILGTVAAIHTTTTDVIWCVAVDDNRLWVQLMDYASGYIHALQMHKSTQEDMGRHEKLMSFYYQKAGDFWRKEGYVSQRSGKLVLSRHAMGPFLW